ncbi:hypothetical protein ACIBCA_25065 [Kitasatospora sp. NPDC051170]|uniref:hypothetical protein n=1 Tax=Kitasatospora sp. NPDC051170 TaxID=3364056 RepID=UPI00379C9647
MDRFPKPVAGVRPIGVQEIKPGKHKARSADTLRPVGVIFALQRVQDLNASSRHPDDFTNRGERLYVHSI